MLHFFIQTWKSVYCPFANQIAVPFNTWTKFGQKFKICTKFWTKLILDEK